MEHFYWLNWIKLNNNVLALEKVLDTIILGNGKNDGMMPCVSKGTLKKQFSKSIQVFNRVKVRL